MFVMNIKLNSIFYYKNVCVCCQIKFLERKSVLYRNKTRRERSENMCVLHWDVTDDVSQVHENTGTDKNAD